MLHKFFSALSVINFQGKPQCRWNVFGCAQIKVIGSFGVSASRYVVCIQLKGGTCVEANELKASIAKSVPRRVG